MFVVLQNRYAPDYTHETVAVWGPFATLAAAEEFAHAENVKAGRDGYDSFHVMTPISPS